jgi:hypothetical protein
LPYTDFLKESSYLYPLAMPHCPGGRSLNAETGACVPLLACRHFSLGVRRNAENSGLQPPGHYHRAGCSKQIPAGLAVETNQMITDRVKDVIKSGGEWISSVFL